METQGIIRTGYQRTVSSGMVLDGKSSGSGESQKTTQPNRIFLRPIAEEMELSIRSQNCLNKAEIKLIGQLVQKSGTELLNLKNFGRISLHEIEKNLTEMGLTLGMTLNFPPWNGGGNGVEIGRS